MRENILLLAASLILIALIPLNYLFAQGTVNLEDRIGMRQSKVKAIAQNDGFTPKLRSTRLHNHRPKFGQHYTDGWYKNYCNF